MIGMPEGYYNREMFASVEAAVRTKHETREELYRLQDIVRRESDSPNRAEGFLEILHGSIDAIEEHLALIDQWLQGVRRDEFEAHIGDIERRAAQRESLPRAEGGAHQ